MKNFFYIGVIFFIGLTLRFILFFHFRNTIGADEAVFALMGKHILEGKEFPIFMWALHYSGTVSSYLSAVLFAISGISSWVFNLLLFLFSCTGIFIFYFFSRIVRDNETRWFTLLFFALPPQFVVRHYIQVANYTEALAISPLLLFFTYKVLTDDVNLTQGKYFLYGLGFLSGFLLWVSPISIFYVLTVISCLLFSKKRKEMWKYVPLISIFFFIGILPVIVYNIQHPLATFSRLGSKLLSDSFRFRLPGGDSLRYLFRDVGYLMGFKTSFYEYGSGYWSWGAGLIYLAAIIYLILRYFKNKQVGTIGKIFFFLIFWVLIAYLMIASPRARYLLPLYTAIPFLFAYFFKYLKKVSCWIAYPLLIFLLFFNLHGNWLFIEKVSISPYEEILSFLKVKGITYGYSDYWTAYPLTFISKEEIIISPRANDPGGFFDRYPLYSQAVRGSERICYILDSEELNLLFKKRMEQKRIRFLEKEIVPYKIYYGFSRNVHPEELYIDFRNLKGS